jgi:hypothetical protein
MTEVKVEVSRQDGFLLVYAKFRSGKIHTTFEISPGVAADVDREGRVLAGGEDLFPKGLVQDVWGD